MGRKLYFKSEVELTAHLKETHAKWHFEFDCRYGNECHGKSGACGFNHLTSGLGYITNDEPIPNGTCRYDRPWDEVRCRNIHCRFDHFRGRVKFLIDLRAAATAAAPAPEQVPAEDPETEYEEDFEEDYDEEDERREADEEYERECHEQYRDVLRGGEIS
jgi:hypothetical protein